MVDVQHYHNSADQETSSTLLERCISARRNGATFPTIWSLILKGHPRNGATFPTIWSLILKGHPLVAGLPINIVREGRIVLEIPLICGRRLVCDYSGKFTLD